MLSNTITQPIERRRQLMECRRHGVVDHHLSRGGHGPLRWQCGACAGEHDASRDRKLERILVSAAGGCCSACGYARSPVNLRFRPATAEDPPFDLASAGKLGLYGAFAAARRCVLVCTNCQNEIEAGAASCPPLGSGWAEG